MTLLSAIASGMRGILTASRYGNGEKQLRVPVDLSLIGTETLRSRPVMPMQDILHVLTKLRNVLTHLDTRVLALGFDSNR